MPAAVNGMKECSKCGETKDVSEYHRNKSRKDGLTPYCKCCVKILSQRRYRQSSEIRERQKERAMQWRKDNRDKYLEQKHRHNSKNKEYYTEWRFNNKDVMSENHKRWVSNNKEHYAKYRRDYGRNRRAEDPAYRLYHNVRNRIRQSLKEFGEHKKNKVKTNKEYYNKYFSVLNYSPEDLVEHIERQWIEGWDWNNYGEVWVVDHIYPHSKLPYDSIEHPNYKKAWALRNLRPLSKEDNSSKSDKVLGEYDDITLLVE